MKNIEELLDQIRWDKTLEEQPELLKIFIGFNDYELKELTTFLHSCEAAKVLKYLGYPRVKNIIPELLECIQDIHLPIVYDVTDLLLSIEIDVLIPFLKGALERAKNNYSWQFCLYSLTRFWPEEKIKELKPELIEIIKDLNNNSSDVLSLLIDKRIMSKKEIFSIIEEKENYYQTPENYSESRIRVLENIKKKIK